MSRSRSVDTIDLSTTRGAYYDPATITQSGSRVIHISGQPGSSRDGHVPADYESQIHLSLLNLRKIILAAGADTQCIAEMTLYIVNYDPSLRQHTRHVQRFLGAHRPAMTLVPVAALAVPAWLFEVDAVVTLPEAPQIPATISDNAADETVDVVVIGAGLAGLSAAQDIVRAGLSCVVVEARDRVGGKTWSQNFGDSKGCVDLGAAWINDTNQAKMYGLAKRFNLELIEQNTTGNCAIENEAGKISSFPYGELPKVL